MKKKSVMALMFAVLLIVATACGSTKENTIDSGSAKAGGIKRKNHIEICRLTA